MFFEGNGVSISLQPGFGKSLIHYAAPVIDRLSSPKKPVAIFIVPPFKALIEDQVHYLNVLGPNDCPPSTLGLFANGAAKLSKPCPAAGRLVT